MADFPLIFLEANPEQPGPRDDAPAAEPRYGGDRGTVFRFFEASVEGVQSRFPHLAPEDIAAPPHHWFDAALARQIALHLLIHHFDVPKRAAAEQLQRNRGSLVQALRRVDDRLQYPAFSEAYQAMVKRADAALSRKENFG